MNNDKLNNLVMAYQQEPSDEIFSVIYSEVSGYWKYSTKIAQSLRTTQHEVIALYEDALMKCIELFDGKSNFMNFFKVCAVRKRADVYEKNKRRAQHELYEEAAEGEEGESMIAATIEQLADPNDLHEEIIRKADQRQLIGILLDGEDEVTTAIVNAYLANPKASNRSIAKDLNLNHQSQVSRTFNRLAGKFESKKIGRKTDYLSA
jgi:DNA-directed RNA polymerase specialized sigma24 family protein